jgi:hypothetical protein
MKRPTYTQYRDPRESTPAAGLPVVTQDGVKLFQSPDYLLQNSFKSKMARTGRFEELESEIRRMQK